VSAPSFTPGPWACCDKPLGVLWTGEGEFLVFDAESRHVVARLPVPIHEIPWTREQAECNTRLIAAAPALHARCDAAVTDLLDEAALLDEWAKASRDGGWSTHQVKPMQDRANELRRRVEDYRAALRLARGEP